MSRLDELLSDVGDGLDTVDVDSTYRPPKRMKVEKIHVIFFIQKIFFMSQRQNLTARAANLLK